MRVFNREEIERVVSLCPDVIRVVEEAFAKLRREQVVMPPVLRVDIAEHNGEVDLKTAYIPGYDRFAVKLSSGFFNNVKWGLPSGNGLMLVIHSRTGVPESLLLDHGYLTDVRTAAAGAVAARYLAPAEARTAGVIGAGAQARFQIEALSLVRNIRRVSVYGPTRSRVEAFVREVGRRTHLEVSMADSSEDVVAQSDVIITATPAKKPVIRAEWLRPGLHITAMGADAEEKQELEPEVLTRADRLVCDVKSQCFRLGECHHAREAGLLDENSSILELGELVTGEASGRQGEEEITVCDLTGTGVQDTAIALYAYKRLVQDGSGVKTAGGGNGR